MGCILGPAELIPDRVCGEARLEDLAAVKRQPDSACARG